MKWNDAPRPRTAQPPLSVEQIQDEICEAAELPLELAQTLPAQAYTSEAFAQWEETHLMRGGWLSVAHVSQIPEPGDFLNLDLLGEPLIVVRGKDRAVRVLSRVCPHRAMDIMPEGFGYDGHGVAETRDGASGCGHTRLFLCPYHSWTFELDGGLKACPEMHEAKGFAREQFTLKPFRTEVWQGFIFVNLNGEAEPLAEHLGEMVEDVAAFGLEAMELVIAREWDCPFNWKVLVENFMESYHHLGIHSKTLQPLMPARDTWTEEERRGYIRAHLPYKEAVAQRQLRPEARDASQGGPPVIAALSDDQKTEWGLFFVGPTFLLATSPNAVIWYRLQPVGPDRMKLLTTVLMEPGTTARVDFEKLRKETDDAAVAFHMEDMEVCTAVQRGLYATGWQRGRLSHLEMPVYLFHRYLAARIRGTWPTVDRPATASQQGRCFA